MTERHDPHPTPPSGEAPKEPSIHDEPTLVFEGTGSDPKSTAADNAPSTIGPYEILRKLGEGGMGVVYEAEQRNPRRRVALKVVRGGHTVDETMLRMFQREVETLARLRHPNIAAIFESGRTDEGQHYFAMELIQGQTLDQYLQRRNEQPKSEDVVERLRLVQKICDAVGYAHQRGVIHRDLKPSNVVIVDHEDSDPHPSQQTQRDRHGAEIKVLDFGLARITDVDVAAATVVTEAGAIKGTLPYMSPEQARGIPEEIDLRSDVYSIGVILYQALTGRLPYETRRVSLLEAVRIICEETPAPFSTSGRRIDPDLETIVLKALEKDPNRRYQSATALGEDLERYLISEPITARPPSAAYQLKKLISRNRTAVALSSLLLGSIIGFGIWMSILYARAEENLDRALKAEAESAKRAEDEGAVSSFLVDMFDLEQSAPGAADTLSMRELLDAGRARATTTLSNQPEVQARLFQRLSQAYEGLGLLGDARPLSEGAVEQSSKVLGTAHPEVLRESERLGRLYMQMGRVTEAESLFTHVIEVRQAEMRERPSRFADGDVERTELEVTRALRRIAPLFVTEDISRETVEFDSLVIHTEVRAPHSPEAPVVIIGPDDSGEQWSVPFFRPIVRQLLREAQARERAGDLEEALAIYEGLMGLRETIPDPHDPAHRRIVNDYARALRRNGQVEQAEKLQRDYEETQKVPPPKPRPPQTGR